VIICRIVIIERNKIIQTFGKEKEERRKKKEERMDYVILRDL